MSGPVRSVTLSELWQGHAVLLAGFGAYVSAAVEWADSLVCACYGAHSEGSRCRYGLSIGKFTLTVPNVSSAGYLTRVVSLSSSFSTISRSPDPRSRPHFDLILDKGETEEWLIRWEMRLVKGRPIDT